MYVCILPIVTASHKGLIYDHEPWAEYIMRGIACPAYMCTPTGVNENDTRATERYEHELLLSVMWTHSVSDVTASLLSLSPIVLYTAVLQAKDLKLKGISKAHTHTYVQLHTLCLYVRPHPIS